MERTSKNRQRQLRGGSWWSNKKRKRKRLIERDGMICKKCLKELTMEEITIDHINPAGKGGGNGLDNLQILCLECHVLKNQNE